MIQRIQTIWLLIASIAAFLTLRFSFYSGTYITDNSYHELRGIDNTYLMFATIVLGGLSFINIFLFKRRSLQIKLAILCILIEAGILFLYVNELKIFSNGNYDLWALLHLVIIVALILAIRGIYKDQKIIKESSRLR
jgi:peptidoglycan/LPS O-acetylase OafA/YrhL